MWGEDKAQKIYFFKKGSYWRFNLKENRVDSVHPRSMSDWRGIPDDIDAAFQDRFGTVVTETLFLACFGIYNGWREFKKSLNGSLFIITPQASPTS